MMHAPSIHPGEKNGCLNSTTGSAKGQRRGRPNATVRAGDLHKIAKQYLMTRHGLSEAEATAAANESAKDYVAFCQLEEREYTEQEKLLSTIPVHTSNSRP